MAGDCKRNHQPFFVSRRPFDSWSNLGNQKKRVRHEKHEKAQKAKKLARSLALSVVHSCDSFDSWLSLLRLQFASVFAAVVLQVLGEFFVFGFADDSGAVVQWCVAFAFSGPTVVSGIVDVGAEFDE